MAVLLLVGVLCACALSLGSVVSPGAASAFELLILHNNDMHARFEQTSQLSGACTPADRDAGKCYGGFPRVAHVVKEARRAAATGEGPPVLYLNAGDTYTGTVWFTIYKWKIAAEFINALQPDAVSLGNHEFDDNIRGLTPFIESLRCPVLAANLILNKVPELQKEPNLKPSVVFDIDGTKVGIVGYLTPDTKFIAVKNDVEYISEIVALKKEVTKLQNGGVNIIIALGHSGYTRDIAIAREVDGLDLVIGGHTNTFLWNGTSPDSESVVGPYPTYVKQQSGRLVPVVQAYAYTKYLGRLHMKFDSHGEAIKIKGKPMLLDNNVPQDPEVLEILDRYRRDKRTNHSNEILGNTSVLLDGHTCKRRECNLGNLITDAIVYDCYAPRYKGRYWTDAPIAVLQGGGIRGSIANTEMPTAVSKNDVLAVMPFTGQLAAVTMNGTILIEMLEHSVSNYNSVDEPGEFLQYSGINVVFDTKRPVGSRVQAAMVRCGECDVPAYSPVIDLHMYKVIIPDFVYHGGDGYFMLQGLPMELLNYSELMCTESYMKRHSPVYPQVEGRIKFISREGRLTFSDFDHTSLNSEASSLTASLAVILGFVANHTYYLFQF